MATGHLIRPNPLQTLAWVALLAAPLLACGPRYARELAFQQGLTEIQLRSEIRDGKIMQRGFQHPITISSTRLARILARVDVSAGKGDEEARKPAIPTESLYEIADGLAAALSKANPTQELAVVSRHRTRRLGVFSEDRLTAFVAYAKDDLLHLHFTHVNWLIPKEESQEKLPEPWAHEVSAEFRVLPAEATLVTGPQAVAVEWRNPIFKQSSTIRITPTGQVYRRTILFEDAEEENAEAEESLEESTAALPENLSPASLRELADLEEARRQGQLTEAEYQNRRRKILEAGNQEP